MKIELEAQPFTTPNFVLLKMPPRPRHEGMIESPKLALKDVDAAVLNQLCDKFRDEIFAKAHKRMTILEEIHAVAVMLDRARERSRTEPVGHQVFDHLNAAMELLLAAEKLI